MNIQEWESHFSKDQGDNIERITSHIKDGDIFVDIGANTGVLSKLIIEELKKQDKGLSKVIMFEPVPLYYNECVKKFGDNPKLGGLVYPIMQSLDEH